MKRQMMAGVALAGALSLWAGAAAFASENSGDAAEALLQQAQGYAAQASDKLSTCAEDKIASFEQTAQTTNGTDASEQALETANDTVLSLVEQYQAQLESRLDTFAKDVEVADENGTALPTFDSFKADIDAIVTAGCPAINAVTITAPSGVNSERDSERDTDSETASAGAARD